VLVTVLPVGSKCYGCNNHNKDAATSITASSTLDSRDDTTTATLLREGDDGSISTGMSSLTTMIQETTATDESPGKGGNKAVLSSSLQSARNNTSAKINTKPSRRNSMKRNNNPPTTETKNAPSKEKEVRAYFFQDAYIRTSCKKYSLNNFADRETHLTNDAVQKHAAKYGQFEEGNKLSLDEWEGVLLQEYPDRAHVGIVQNKIMPAIRRMSKISIAAVEESFKQTDIHRSFELY